MPAVPDEVAREAAHRSTGRDPALDLLRALALGRVVVWHAVGATWLTAFAAIPLMFFVAGALLAGSLSRQRHRDLLARRSRRLLMPLWGYGLVVAVVGLVQAVVDGAPVEIERSGLLRAITWMVPVVDPVDSHWHGGWLSSHLWYLRAYLWILVLAPVLGALAKRAALATAVFALLIVQLEVARHTGLPLLGGGSARIMVGDAVTYGLFTMLGMAYRLRTSPLPRPAVMAAAAAGFGAAAVGYSTLAGLPEGGINASYPALILTGLAWLLAAGAAESSLRRVAGRPAVSRMAGSLSRRAVTIYLWHPAAIVLAYAIVGELGHATMPVVVVLTAGLTALAVRAVGFVEDWAAGRPPRQPERRRIHLPSVRGAAVLPAVIAALVATTPMVAEPIVFPAAADADVPSRRLATRPPSYRAALGNSAFAAEGHDEPPIRVRNGRMPVRQLQKALDRWRAAHPEVDLVAVSVDVDGRTWSGRSRPPHAGAIDIQERYRIASLTKTFTTALVLRAADAQLLGLDAPVPALPGVGAPPRGTAISPRQLLQHTSGLVDYVATDDYRGDEPVTPEQAVSWSLRTPLLWEPGADVHYANTNYLYLGLLLELVTGRAYGDLVGELASEVGLPGIHLGAEVQAGWVGHASGGIYANVGELARWGKLLFQPGAVLSPHRISELTTLGEHNMGVGTWPLCPCWLEPDGSKAYRGVGHHVGNGGLYHEPATGLTFAIRVEPANERTQDYVTSLRNTLVATLRR